MNVSEAMAQAFAAEGTDTVFGLMGDGNMYWMALMGRLPGVELVHARHESAAVAMADGYARASGQVGVASVTSGPGVTQIATSLTASARHGTPLVIFAGDTPQGAAFNLQEFNQEPFARACDAGFVSAHRPERAPDDVALAFYRARHEGRPILVRVPWDVQEVPYPWDFEPSPSSTLLPPPQRVAPDPSAVDEAATAVANARRPVVLAGRGAVSAGAGPALIGLADRVGALLATSLRAKGFFDGEAFDVGVCGAFSTDVARRLLAEADCVIGVGARLGYFTTEAGYMFPEATIVQVDSDPLGYVDGQQVADIIVEGDAARATEALSQALRDRGVAAAGYRSDEVRRAIETHVVEEPEYPPYASTVDPRTVVAELDEAVPKDWLVTVGCGHFWNFVVAGLHGRPPEVYTFTYDFGVVGQGLPTAMGVARARPDERVVLIEGDGGLLMNVQELEALGRHRIPVLVVVMNDGGFGAEVHKMRAKGFVDDEAVFGFPALDEVAQALGIEAHRVDEDGQVAALVESFGREPRPLLIDARVSPNVLSRPYRRLYLGQASG